MDPTVEMDHRAWFGAKNMSPKSMRLGDVR